MYEIKEMFSKFVNLFDNGQMYITPMKWLYWINAVVPFLTPLAAIAFAVNYYDMIEYYGSGWAKFIYFVVALVLIAVSAVWAYFNFLFWKNRIQRLSTLVSKGDRIVALPLLANYIQFSGECTAMFVAYIGTTTVVLGYLFLLLSGYDGFYSDANFIKILFAAIGIILLILIVAYGIALLARFIAEQINLFVHMSKDLRDVADVTRAATIVETEVSVEE